MRPPDLSSPFLVVLILCGRGLSLTESRAKRSIVDFDYAVQEGIASALGGVEEAVIQKDNKLVETQGCGNLRHKKWSKISRKRRGKGRKNSKKRAKRDVYERLLADFEADVDRLVDYFDDEDDVLGTRDDGGQMVIRLKRSISDDEGGVGDLLDPTLDLVAWPDSSRATDDGDRIKDEPVKFNTRGDKSPPSDTGIAAGSGSAGAVTAAAEAGAAADLTRKDVREIARRSDMRQVMRWLAELAKGNKDTVMRELIKAKEEVAVETEENASEEIIVAPDPVLMSVLMSKSNPEASAVRHASHHAEKHHHNKRKTKKKKKHKHKKTHRHSSSPRH